MNTIVLALAVMVFGHLGWTLEMALTGALLFLYVVCSGMGFIARTEKRVQELSRHE
jgi:hypothetical protein